MDVSVKGSLRKDGRDVLKAYLVKVSAGHFGWSLVGLSISLAWSEMLIEVKAGRESTL